MRSEFEPYTPPMREKELQAVVLDLMALLKWKAYHTFDSRRSEAGFPDIVAVRGDRIVWVELKSATGKLTDAQREWAYRLLLAGANWYEWRPEDWVDGTIKRILQ